MVFTLSERTILSISNRKLDQQQLDIHQLFSFFLNRFFRDHSMEISIFRKLNLWHANYDKGRVHQGTLKNRSLSHSPGARLLTPATTLNN